MESEELDKLKTEADDGVYEYEEILGHRKHNGQVRL